MQRAASLYVGFHMTPIPVPPRSKEPNRPGWPDLRPTQADLAALFCDAHSNIGILLGEPSGNLADVDLDCPEAVAAARGLLPHTGWVSGRYSSRYSHHWCARC
jgi:hypothetical protein